MHPFRLLSFAFLSTAAASAAGTDHSPAPAATDERIHLDELVVTGTAGARNQSDLAQATGVLAGVPLTLRLQPTLGATLATEPGIGATDFGPGASRPLIRGLGGDRVRVLENETGSLDVSALSPDHALAGDPLFAERIEIVRGPATLFYGGTAIGGVVNVIDDRVPAQRAETVSGRAEIRGATGDRSLAGALVLRGGRGDVAWQVRGFDRSTGEVRIPGSNRHEHGDEADRADPDHVVGRLPNSAVDSRGWSFGLSRFGARGQIGAAFSAFDTRYGVPPGAHAHAGEEEEGEEAAGHDEAPVVIHLRQRRGDAVAAIERPGGPFARAELRLAASDYTHREFEGGAVGTRFDQTAREARLELPHQPWGNLTGAWGLQYQSTDLAARGDEAFLPPVRSATWAAFAAEEWRQGALTWQAGFRLEGQRHRPEAGSGRPARDDSGVSASLGVVWRIDPVWSLALSAARTARLPSAAELYADGPHAGTGAYEIGDADVRHERARSVELSLRRQAGFVTGSATVYRTRFDRFLFEAPTTETIDDLPVYRLAERAATFSGGEIELWWHLHQGRRHTLDLRTAADWVRATEDAAGAPLPRIPPHRLMATFRWVAEGFTVEADIVRAQRQGRVAPGEEPTAGYTLAGLAVSRSFNVGRAVCTAFVRGSNLGNAEARNHASFLKEVAPLPGRSFTAGLRTEF